MAAPCPLFCLICIIVGLDGKIEGCQEDFKYTTMNSNGELEKYNLAGVIYADDICLFTNNTESLQQICDNVSAVIDKYGLKVSDMRSKVVCINGVSGNGKLVALILVKQKNIST